MSNDSAKRIAIRRACTVVAMAAILGVNSAAVAQEGELEEIVVTGSHIKRNTFNYSTPITVIDAVEISSTGTTNLGDLLQTLPQSISSINNANTAFSTTFSGLNLTDLRFLGTDRTLVLVNGRRFVSGAPPGGGTTPPPGGGTTPPPGGGTTPPPGDGTTPPPPPPPKRKKWRNKND